jgi:hypothetical protein
MSIRNKGAYHVMNEADRIARERAWQEQAQQEAQRAAGRRAAAARREELIAHLEREVPAVLQLLKEHGYPDMISLRVRIPAFLRSSDEIMGAWLLYRPTADELGDSVGAWLVSYNIYLLSDGVVLQTPAGMPPPYHLPGKHNLDVWIRGPG